MNYTRIRPSIAPTAGISLVQFLQEIAVHKLTFITLLLLGFCCCDCLNNVETGFRVGELFDLLDLQALVFVCDDMCDEDRFAVYVNPD